MPAEWERQDAVMLAWPHAGTDWLRLLPEIREAVLRIALAVARFETLFLLVDPRHDDPARVRAVLLDAGVPAPVLRVAAVPFNDTWLRDYGPITVFEDGVPHLLDYSFNGWGLKYPAHLDNRVTARLRADGHFGRIPLEVPGLWLEGGSIDSDGEGTLLTTRRCLIGPNRNPLLDEAGYAEQLDRQLGARRLLWLDHGALEGDDTDSHIDTLARFAPGRTIVWQGCDDPADPHYAELARMAAELRQLRDPDGRPWRLLELPWPPACHDPDDGHRLPATYANFLVINEAVLAPTYGDEDRDFRALAVLAEAFPDREIVPLDCRAVIRQHGSLHCLSMQIPEGVLP